MLQRNLLYTGVTRGKRPRRPSLSPCATSQADGVGRAGGMAERGCLEALRECMMSGVTVLPWRSRIYLASGKVGNKSIASFRACFRHSAIPQLLAYCRGAANRRFGPNSQHCNQLQIADDQHEPGPFRQTATRRTTRRLDLGRFGNFLDWELAHMRQNRNRNAHVIWSGAIPVAQLHFVFAPIPSRGF